MRIDPKLGLFVGGCTLLDLSRLGEGAGAASSASSTGMASVGPSTGQANITSATQSATVSGSDAASSGPDVDAVSTSATSSSSSSSSSSSTSGLGCASSQADECFDFDGPSPMNGFVLNSYGSVSGTADVVLNEYISPPASLKVELSSAMPPGGGVAWYHAFATSAGFALKLVTKGIGTNPRVATVTWDADLGCQLNVSMSDLPPSVSLEFAGAALLTLPVSDAPLTKWTDVEVVVQNGVGGLTLRSSGVSDATQLPANCVVSSTNNAQLFLGYDGVTTVGSRYYDSVELYLSP